ARGEPIRLALHISSIPFVDERIEWSDWPALKSSTPFGELPVLHLEDGTQIAQSQAILRYVGKLSGLYPEDRVKAAKVDQVMAAFEDLSTQLQPSIYEENLPTRLQMRRDLIAPSSRFTTLLRHLDALIASNGTGFAVGSSLTVADLSLYGLVDWIQCGELDGITTEYIGQFPRVVKVAELVRENEKVNEWYKDH
ncbi:hypothetical protein HK104_007153, partial [Borealophlyctis nickersoniae]